LRFHHPDRATAMAAPEPSLRWSIAQLSTFPAFGGD
jgi:hypothetical protein